MSRGEKQGGGEVLEAANPNDAEFTGCADVSPAGWTCSLPVKHKGRCVALATDPVEVCSTWRKKR